MENLVNDLIGDLIKIYVEFLVSDLHILCKFLF